MSQLVLAAEHRAFHADFWCMGVCFGGRWNEHLASVARALVDFHERAQGLQQFEARNGDGWFEHDVAAAYELGPEAYVKYQWARLAERWRTHDVAAVSTIIEAARRHPGLRLLFPFTSLYRLSFSFTTGYPFEDIGYSVVPDGLAYVVRTERSNDQMRFDNVQAALDYISSQLTKPAQARHGTAEST